jgi:hypothetical protein
MSFGGTTEVHDKKYDAFWPCNKETIEEAVDLIESLQPASGKCNIFSALVTALELSQPSGWDDPVPTKIFLISGGKDF